MIELFHVTINGFTAALLIKFKSNKRLSHKCNTLNIFKNAY